MLERQEGVELDPVLEARIAEWLSTEIQQTDMARKALEEEWAEISRLYDSVELEGKKDFPFVNAAALMIPIVPMIVETMKAKIFTTIFAPKDPLSAKTRRDDLQDFVKQLRAFLTWAAENELNLRERLDTNITEALKLGTTVGKTVYTRETRRQRVWNEDLEEWEEELYVIRDSPEIVHPPLANVYFPLETTDDTLNECPWIAEKFDVTRNKLKRWKHEKRFDKERLEKIMHWEDDQAQETEVERERKQHGEDPVLAKTVTLHEVWFDHQISDDDETLYKLVGYLHVPSRTFLKVTHGWFPYALHPYEILVHEKREHKVYGNGVGAIARVFQLEISTQHNQRLDAMTIANANAFKKKADSLIPEDIVIRPGGTIPVDDMDDLQPLFTGQKYDSTIQEEQNTLALLRERVGLQEYAPDTLANAQSTSLTLALGESTRRFDQTVNRVRGFISRLSMKLMLLYQKYYPEGKPFFVMGQDGQMVSAMLQFPSDFIYNNVLIEVTATTSVTSAELERQNKLALFNLITQGYGQITQYAMGAENPQAPIGFRLASLAAITGISTYVADVLDDYNLSNARDLAQGLRNLKALAEFQQNQVLGALSGGQPGMGGVPGAPGAPVPEGAGGLGGQPQQGGGV